MFAIIGALAVGGITIPLLANLVPLTVDAILSVFTGGFSATTCPNGCNHTYLENQISLIRQRKKEAHAHSIKLLLQHGRKKFNLYYAKGCFKIVSKETADEVERAKYFAIGLTWYNRFLKKNINLQINDVMKIYSKIITHSPLDTNKALISISQSFDSEDGLKPLRYLSAFFPDTEVGQILTKETLRMRIKESSDLVIPIITVIITVITTFILKKP